MQPYYVSGGITLYHGDYREVLPSLVVGHIITDPPFSERTHSGHDAGARPGVDGAARKRMGYTAWTPDDVHTFVGIAALACSGWIVALTDHTLAPTYGSALADVGRYAFAPLPFFAPGSTVRLSGDGPCSWTTWIVVARTAAQHRWGTLPGGYVAGRGWSDRQRMGGKPLQLMQSLVRDYSRAEDVVCDPCCGAGTTLVAAKNLGRPAVGIELDEEMCERTALRLSQEVLAL